MSLAARIDRVLEAIGYAASPEARALVARWIADVAQWNRRTNLTRARSEDELVDLMLADAAVLAAALPEAARVVDVGSGAGAPGLPLSILRADLSLTLVEPMHKRAALLRLAASKLGLGLRVEQTHGERVPGPFDVAISRATLAPPEWLALGARLAPAGQVWVLLAREEPPALEGWEAFLDRRYRWPLTGAERRAVGYRRP